ncbi:MAG: hypothetical protein AAF583_01160, partial [Pseudomonadota bacterium]
MMHKSQSTIVHAADISKVQNGVRPVGTLTRLRTNTALVSVLLTFAAGSAYGQVSTPAGSSCSVDDLAVTCPAPIPSGDGISVFNVGVSSDPTVEVTTNGIVSNQDGVEILMAGGTERSVSVDNTGDIQAIAGSGVDISVDNQGDGADVDVTVDGNITSQEEAIVIFLGEEGSISVNVTGNVETLGDDAVGILAVGGAGDDGAGNNLVGDGDISIVTTGNITTNGEISDAISASNDGDGDVSVTHTGDIITLASSSDGIDVFED